MIRKCNFFFLEDNKIFFKDVVNIIFLLLVGSCPNVDEIIKRNQSNDLFATGFIDVLKTSFKLLGGIEN